MPLLKDEVSAEERMAYIRGHVSESHPVLEKLKEVRRMNSKFLV